MTICNNSASSQLKAIQARLDRIDEDLMCHYAGISQLVTCMLAHPLTAPAAIKSALTYNFSSAGQTLLKELLHMVPGYDQFRQLQHIQSAALLDAMEGTLATIATNMVNQAVSQAESLVQQQGDALVALATAQANEAVATAAGAVGPALQTLQNATATAQQVVNTLNSLVGTANAAKSAIETFLEQLTDVSQCRTRSQIIDGTQGTI